MSTWLPVLLVTMAVALLTLPGRRHHRPGRSARSFGRSARARGRRIGGRRTGQQTRAGVASGAGPTVASQARRTRSDSGLPFGSVLVEVAARLRTGAALPEAWRATLAGQPGAPATLAELARAVPAGPRADAVAGARTAVAVADRLGTPVADVLECCAQGLAEAEEGAGQRRTAMAAPRATARLLAWLPLAGLGLGVLLGVDPVAVFADAGLGTACLLLGLVLMALGRRWSAALVHRAERAGL